ncbi:MAG: aldehyde ferredoxin oxidoreductase family protein [Candidatus Helarchaeota archaeon]|nr:aldehyde ferredoxin oxidoreductase family protein [Candidatus Helarchaeota archaeon]
MLFGYNGKILRVDLNAETVANETIPEETYRKYIGGRGLAARILYDELPKNLDPLDGKNEVIFMTGPYTGVSAPASARFEVATLSSQTGLFGAANAGGFFGPMLKRAGFDGVVIRGKAKSPLYLWVSEDKGELRDAQHLWGEDTYKTEDLIREELQNERIRVACIGPAGENLVNFAAIMCDRGRAAARSGAGAVLGSKNFKGIACFGKKQIPIAHKAKFKEVATRYNKKVLKDPLFQFLRLYGTPGTLVIETIFGELPVKNWMKSNFDGAEKITGHGMYKTILVKDHACLGCTISCKRSVRIDKGKYKLPENPTSGPELETLCALGTLCMNDNIYAIAKANDLCNRFGMDTISTGSTIAFAMECYEKGLISKADLGGIDLKWGDADAIIACVNLIAKKEGIGKLLAQGTTKASKNIKGSENFVVAVKGLEVAMHEPRANQMLGLHYATTPYGGRHSSAVESIFSGISSVPAPDLDFVAKPTIHTLDRLSPLGKPRPLITIQDRNMMMDSSCMCTWFIAYGVLISHRYLSALLTLITGWKMSYREIFLKTGERISNLIQAFNIKHGATMEDYTLPHRLLKEPLKEGGSHGHVVYLKSMLREYFKLRNWDFETAKPNKEKLVELGLEKVANDLWP